MPIKIAIIGGGVAGMSAAHELAERKQYSDFDIQIYEANPAIPGGKARSIAVPNSAPEGRPALPGEHGFRFFPGFYKHLPHTMERIPYRGRSVADNLVSTSRLLIGRFDTPPLITISRFPTGLDDIVQMVEMKLNFAKTGLTRADVEFFGLKLWQIMTSCYERRLAEYEKIAWWDFVDANNRSMAYQNFLARGLARGLAANDPHKGSTKTLGDTYVQLLFNIIEPNQSADRLLNGPSNDVWLNPWRTYLEHLGVGYTLGASAQSIRCADGTIKSVTLRHADGRIEDVEADYFIFAVPVEVMARLLERDSLDGAAGPLLTADPALAGVIALQEDVAWMNGIQFYLKEDVPIVHGHQLYVDSPWAITAVSQIQFWQPSGYQITQHGDGTVKGILSTTVSNWEEPGILYGKPARECSPEEIAREVWAQITRSLNHPQDSPILSADLIHSWYLYIDRTSSDAGSEGTSVTNAEPLLVNQINRRHLRPKATTRIANMLLASDYVRTYTDLACMESANEAARHAVNAILGATQSRAPLCEIWNVHEQDMALTLYRWTDLQRFRAGLAWDREAMDKV